MAATTWRVVEGVQPARPTNKGDAQINVKTDKGYLYVRGARINEVKQGDKIEIDEPKQFGKSWYTELKDIEAPAGQSTAPETSNASRPDHLAYALMIQWAHDIAIGLEPDAYLPTEDGTKAHIAVDRSRARAAIMNTLLIAHGKGCFTWDETPF